MAILPQVEKKTDGSVGERQPEDRGRKKTMSSSLKNWQAIYINFK